jgi:hypothetical protein
MEACGTDDELRGEIEELLAQPSKGEKLNRLRTPNRMVREIRR